MATLREKRVARRNFPLELKIQWCCVGKKVKHKNVVSKEVIRVKLPPQEVYKAGVSSITLSLQRKYFRLTPKMRGSPQLFGFDRRKVEKLLAKQRSEFDKETTISNSPLYEA